MTPTTVVAWKWRDVDGRSRYTAEHVNTLYQMVLRHYPPLERFVCVTDDAAGIDDCNIDVIPLWPDYAGLRNPRGRNFPSCYRRLPMFSDEARVLFGERFVSLDLDAVVLGDVTPLWNRPEEFVAWRDPIYPQSYNGSMVMQTAGTRRRVWDSFDGNVSPQLAHRAGCLGSDQGWITYTLGPNEATWTRADGVYSYSIDLKRGSLPLPRDAKVVFFHGAVKPWQQPAAALHWVREHYR